MSDLISRQAVLQFVQRIKDTINDNKCFGDGTRKLNMGDLQDIILFVKNIPTAYDVDAVVAELEKASKTMMPVIPTKDAVAIVRKGGVE